MSAPQTNIDKQKRRHWGPLTGIALVLGLVAVLFFAYTAYVSTNEETVAPEVSGPAGQAIPSAGAPATSLSDTDPAPTIIDQSGPVTRPVTPAVPQPAD